jgi:hypothetical protein
MILPPVYWVLACCSEAYKYLCNQQTVPEVLKNIESAIQSKPEIFFRIQCYHMETVTHTDSKGNTRRSKRRVNTHFARQAFNTGEV